MSAGVPLLSAARALGGEICRGAILCPGPNHSPRDRSLSVRFSSTAPDGFVVHSFAGDAPLDCKDYVRARLGLRREPVRPLSGRVDICPSAVGPSEAALRLWREARNPADTPVIAYLRRRGLSLPKGAAGHAIRFHPACPFKGERTPAMVALARDVRTNEARAIHRTAIRSDGSPTVIAGEKRLSLGPIGGCAVKLTPDENVTLSLGVGEGIESTLSLRELPECGAIPVWALLSAGNLGALPVLGGVETLWIAEDRDPAGENSAATLETIWTQAGRETLRVRARAIKADLNDVVKGRAHV